MQKPLKNPELSCEALPENQGWAWKWKAFPLLQLRRQHDQLYDLVFLNPTLLTRCQSAFCETLNAWMTEQQAEIRLLEPPASPLWRSGLLQTGLAHYQKYFYQRTLAFSDFPEPPNYQWQSLVELGEAAFVADLQSLSVGDPETEAWAERGWSAEQEFEQLKDHAGSAFTPQNWLRISQAGQPVGLILPQIYPDKPQEGTLFYFGVFPGLRGQKHGQALHRLGLQRLAQSGVTRYVGSTDLRNQAMQRIFAVNGCEQTRLLTFFHAHGGD